MEKTDPSKTNMQAQDYDLAINKEKRFGWTLANAGVPGTEDRKELGANKQCLDCFDLISSDRNYSLPV